MMDILNTIKKLARAYAESVQTKAPEMNGTELNSEKDFIPKFNPERQYTNFPIGYVCKSSAGRVVKLLQPYDSTIYTSEPEELTAQWGFVWSDNPAHALPYIALSTSPYMVGNVCTENDIVYRSCIDNNVWSPSTYPAGWEVVTA